MVCGGRLPEQRGQNTVGREAGVKGQSRQDQRGPGWSLSFSPSGTPGQWGLECGVA